jgi:hypothetical protein
MVGIRAALAGVLTSTVASPSNVTAIGGFRLRHGDRLLPLVRRGVASEG